MDIAKKNLKQTGILTIVLAIVDIVVGVLMIANPEDYPTIDKINDLFASGGIANETSAVILGVVLVILCICIIVVGLKAIIVSKGGRQSKAVDILSVVLQVIFMIFALYTVVIIITDHVDVLRSNVFIPLVTVIALGSIANYQKKLNNLKER